MGNTVGPGVSTRSDIKSYLPAINDTYSHKATLGMGKVFKSIQCVHEMSGDVIIKVYVKKDTSLSLTKYEERLEKLRNSFKNLMNNPGVLILNPVMENKEAIYLVRQYFAYNLTDRVHTQPFLADIEKRWVSFQLLSALVQCHLQDVRHGDIKCENICSTSWNWIFLTDFAFYKPTFLPADNPADYSLFFDTGHRRRCYLACERFFDDGKDLSAKLNSGSNDGENVTEAMDMFSVGCVIAEIFLEGEAIFDLSQVLSYRGIGDKEQKYNPLKIIQKIKNVQVRALVQHMIQIDPLKRLSAKEYLQKWSEGDDALFPKYFIFLYHFFTKLLSAELASPDLKIQLIKETENTILEELVGIRNNNNMNINNNDTKESKNIDITKKQDKQHTLEDFISRLENQDIITNIDIKFYSHDINNNNNIDDKKNDNETNIINGEGLVMIIQTICACIQNVRFPLTKITALELLETFGKYVDDDIRLGRILPYCVAMLSDNAAMIQATALKTLTKILSYVQNISVADAHLFRDYIFPALSRFTSLESEELVRLAYAQCIVTLAQTARKFLDMGQQSSKSILPYDVSFDAELASLQETVLKIVIEMLQSHAGSKVKRSLLSNITDLCVFLGRKRVNDEILPHLITVLNDPDGQLRAAFFEQIVGVSIFIGRMACQNFILPCLEQTLFDAEELVIHSSLRVLASLIEIGLFEKQVLLSTVSRVIPLLCYPSTWLRNQAIDLIVAVAKSLGKTRSYAFLQPLLSPICNHRVLIINNAADLQYALKPALSRAQFKQLLLNCNNNNNQNNNNNLEMSNEIVLVEMEDGTISEIKDNNKSNNNNQNNNNIMNNIDNEMMDVMKQYAARMSASIEMQDFQSIQQKKQQNIDDDNDTADMMIYKNLHHNIPVYEIAVERTFSNQNLESNNNKLNSNYHSNVSIRKQEWEKELKNMNAILPPKLSGEAQLLYDRLYHKKSVTSVNINNVKTQSIDNVPEYITKALCIPSQPPALGNLHIDTISVSSFYNNFHDFDVEDIPENRPSYWRPRGILIASLNEHTQAVNKLSVSRDNLFMVSACDDGTVKIWDCQKISVAAHIKRSQATYVQGGRINDVIVCDSTHSVASVSDNQSIHVFKIEYASKSCGLSEVKKFEPSQGEVMCVEHFNTISESLLVYGNKSTNIYGWDLRSNIDTFILKLDPRLGVGMLTKMCIGPSPYCIIIGTSGGYIIVWDLRFQIPVQMWRHSSKSSIRYLSAIDNTSILNCNTAPLVQRAQPLHSTFGPLIFISADGENSISGCDLYTGETRIVFRAPNSTKQTQTQNNNNNNNTSNNNESKSHVSSLFYIPNTTLPKLNTCFQVDGSVNISSFGTTFSNELAQSVRISRNSSLHCVTSMLCCQESFVMTAGTDRVVRFWDLVDQDDSYWVSGYGNMNKSVNYHSDIKHRRKLEHDTVVFEETYSPNFDPTVQVGQIETPTSHTDSILDMKVIQYPDNFVVTAARNGEIRVFG